MNEQNLPSIWSFSPIFTRRAGIGWNIRPVTFAQDTAVAYAQRVSTELPEEQKKITLKVEELGQVTSVAPQNLSPPISNIGGFAEMIREDLENCPKSPTSKAEAALNLGQIEARVARINDLTRSLIEYPG